MSGYYQPAQQQVAEARESMGTDHDEIHPVLGREIHDGGRCGTDIQYSITWPSVFTGSVISSARSCTFAAMSFKLWLSRLGIVMRPT